MKNDSILVGIVALVAGLIIGWMAGQKSSTPVPAVSQGPAPANAPASMVNAQQKLSELKAIVARDPQNRQAWVALGNEYFDGDQPMESVCTERSRVAASSRAGATVDMACTSGDVLHW